jgi:hypothetical protein
VIEDGPDDGRVFDAADDPHDALTFRTDQGIYFVYLLNQPRPAFPESLFVSLRIEDAGNGVIQTFLLPFPPGDVAVVAVISHHLFDRFGIWEHMAASHSRAGNILLDLPFLAV